MCTLLFRHFAFDVIIVFFFSVFPFINNTFALLSCTLPLVSSPPYSAFVPAAGVMMMHCHRRHCRHRSRNIQANVAVVYLVSSSLE